VSPAIIAIKITDHFQLFFQKTFNLTTLLIIDQNNAMTNNC